MSNAPVTMPAAINMVEISTWLLLSARAWSASIYAPVIDMTAPAPARMVFRFSFGDIDAAAVMPMPANASSFVRDPDRSSSVIAKYATRTIIRAKAICTNGTIPMYASYGLVSDRSMLSSLSVPVFWRVLRAWKLTTVARAATMPAVVSPAVTPLLKSHQYVGHHVSASMVALPVKAATLAVLGYWRAF